MEEKELPLQRLVLFGKRTSGQIEITEQGTQ